MGGPGSGRRKADPVDRAVASVVGPGTNQVVIPALGDPRLQPLELLNPQEQYMVAKLQGALQRSFLGDKNPMWNNAKELEIAQSVSFDMHTDIAKMLSFNATSSPNGSIGINDRFSKRYPVADLNVPRNPLAVMELSLRYAAENPFVAKALRVKAEFASKDFTHKTHKTAAKKFYDDYAETLFLRSQLPKMFWSLSGVGICPVYWGGEEGGRIQWIQILQPHAVHIENILGRNKMWLRITPKMVAAVRDPNGEESPVNKAQYQSMPKYWIEQISKLMKLGKTSGLIELQDGSYTVIDSRYMPYNRAENTLDGVPLQGCFDALQRYRLLAAGDFAVAWNVKNMLTLISEGDPNADSKDYRPADNVRLQKLYQQFTHPDYALTVFCDPTTQVRYVVPPLEVFNPIKYQQVEKEIKEVLNLPSFMWSNDGKGTYGAAQAEVQLLRQEIDTLRMIMEDQFFRPFYKRLRVSAGARFAESDIPMPTFSQNSLRDDSIWLGATADLYSRGGPVSLQTLADVFGFDYEYEMEQKKKEHAKYGNTSTGEPGEPANNSPARPLFEPSQGNLIPTRDKGGNPGKPDGEPDKIHRNPRKSGD